MDRCLSGIVCCLWDKAATTFTTFPPDKRYPTLTSTCGRRGQEDRSEWDRSCSYSNNTSRGIGTYGYNELKRYVWKPLCKCHRCNTTTLQPSPTSLKSVKPTPGCSVSAWILVETVSRNESGLLRSQVQPGIVRALASLTAARNTRPVIVVSKNW